jgi:hypothetical protein
MKEVEDVLEQNKQQQYKEYQYQTILNLDVQKVIKSASIP